MISNESMHTLITRMSSKLDSLIESNNFNLQNKRVLQYSRLLDKALIKYNRRLLKKNVVLH